MNESYYNYVATFNTKNKQVKYCYNIDFENILSEYETKVESYGVYFNNAYFTKNIIECNEFYVFLSATEDIEQDFICVKADKLEKLYGYRLMTFSRTDIAKETEFILVSPMAYSRVDSSNVVIYTPSAIQGFIKDEIKNKGLCDQDDIDKVQVRFKSKYRTIKSIESSIGNVWGYNGQIEITVPITMKKFSFGDIELSKRGYNCVVGLNML